MLSNSKARQRREGAPHAREKGSGSGKGVRVRKRGQKRGQGSKFDYLTFDERTGTFFAPSRAGLHGAIKAVLKYFQDLNPDPFCLLDPFA